MTTPLPEATRPGPADAAAIASRTRQQELAAALARTALGDREAFARLYRLTSAHLFGVILRIDSDRQRAEDILQDTFVNVWRAAGGFDAARSQPSTWLTSIARHRAIDSLRRRQTEPVTVSRWATRADGRDGDESVDLLALLPDDEAGPAQRQAEARTAHGIHQCLGDLSAAQRQCLALTYYQGLSHAEAAARLEQPLGSVKSWVRRGLQALRQCLERAGIDRES